MNSAQNAGKLESEALGAVVALHGIHAGQGEHHLVTAHGERVAFRDQLRHGSVPEASIVDGNAVWIAKPSSCVVVLEAFEQRRRPLEMGVSEDDGIEAATA